MQLNLKKANNILRMLVAINRRRRQAVVSKALMQGGWRMGEAMAQKAIDTDPQLGDLWQRVQSAEVVIRTLEGEVCEGEWTMPHLKIVLGAVEKYGIKI